MQPQPLAHVLSALISHVMLISLVVKLSLVRDVSPGRDVSSSAGGTVARVAQSEAKICAGKEYVFV